ncbi:outer membrane beta-barrel protein [Spirosoma panaciterrae]|uniref:outer membrane beta-barrel protein n=1 Tax=Spirosoma panaciterrae TaxID=496058 RepID=UPI00037F4C7F|nr:outer membrane beta-barrel protein [Spirosoma panaciterrae]
MKNIAFLLFIGILPNVVWGQLLGPEIPQRPSTDLDRKIDTFLQASIDMVRQKLLNPSYAGTPYAATAPTPGDVLALNLAIQFHNQGLVNQIIHYYTPSTSQHVKPADPSTLLATNDPRTGPTVPPDKAPFLSHVSLLYGVQLIGKGSKTTYKSGTSTTRMTYLEIPAYMLYNHDLPSNKGRLFGGVGFYLAYGLWGTIKDSDNTPSVSAFDKNLGYKRFDAGLAFTGGYQLPQGLRLSIAYELGLVNIDPFAGAYDKLKNRALSLNVAYSLHKVTALAKKK